MFEQLPDNYDAVKDWMWDEIEPYITDLLERELSEATIDQWMRDWTRISAVADEIFTRARVKTTQDTTDEEADAKYKDLMQNLYPHLSETDNRLNKKLVESGIVPENFDVPYKKLLADIETFREENIPLFTQQQAIGMQYSKTSGGMTIEWEGEEKTLVQMAKVNEDQDRAVREKAFLMIADRWLQDREEINGYWTQLFNIRQQMAKNAGYLNIRDYMWRLRKRFDYTPEDCETFHASIREVVVPAAQRLYEKRRQRLGLNTLRPWDLDVDPENRPPLNPWQEVNEFANTTENIFNKVDPKLGEYFSTMRAEDLLDIPNRKGKRPGAYCTSLPLTGRPFILMNAIGAGNDVRTLLHESGHAFHVFETLHLPYDHQRNYPIEFAEVASMAMELLSMPYVTQDQGGYFTEQEAAIWRIRHLEKIVKFWPYMAVVDSFQHWAYAGGDEAANPAACDAKWSELWDTYMVGIDWSGFDAFKETGWHRKQHIYLYPFYYIEYGLAQLGAVQVWANALNNQTGAVQSYLNGLSLGGTRSIPELFSATDVKFAFDAETMQSAIDLIEKTLDESETALV